MTRCSDCNGILIKGESNCFGCGTPAPDYKKPRVWDKGFAGLITLTFFASVGLTAFSWFSERTPPFTACLTASVILLFVKRSADQFVAQRR